MENPKYTENKIGRCRSRKLDLRLSKEKGKFLEKISDVFGFMSERENARKEEGEDEERIELLGM